MLSLWLRALWALTRYPGIECVDDVAEATCILHSLGVPGTMFSSHPHHRWACDQAISRDPHFPGISRVQCPSVTEVEAASKLSFASGRRRRESPLTSVPCLDPHAHHTMNSVKVARAALRARPGALRVPVQKRGYADVAPDKIRLSLALPHQVCCVLAPGGWKRKENADASGIPGYLQVAGCVRTAKCPEEARAANKR